MLSLAQRAVLASVLASDTLGECGFGFLHHRLILDLKTQRQEKGQVGLLIISRSL